MPKPVLNLAHAYGNPLRNTRTSITRLNLTSADALPSPLFFASPWPLCMICQLLPSLSIAATNVHPTPSSIPPYFFFQQSFPNSMPLHQLSRVEPTPSRPRMPTSTFSSPSLLITMPAAPASPPQSCTVINHGKREGAGRMNTPGARMSGGSAGPNRADGLPAAFWSLLPCL